MERVSYVSTVPEMRSKVREWRAHGETVALLPTMGALHSGHLSLAKIGKDRCDRVVTSIFVNPTQFAPQEDFSAYPRTFESDLEKLVAVGCDLVWAPTADVMYPDGFATMIKPEGAALGLETNFRPHFFSGVATVCCKLFTQCGPDIALFGEKDYQQLCVVQQVVRDLDLPLEIVGCETVREPDGLAMSSRNAYLSDSERQIATAMHSVISRISDNFRAGGDPDELCRDGSEQLQQAGFQTVDYVAIRDAGDLAKVATGSSRPCRVLAAAWLGETRLIDNVAA
ncbi:MAG: pantoate--beta-alanine ligase [Pseudomonadota bacterium]